MDIYNELKTSGVELANWCSDLYAKDCEKTREIIKEYKFKCNCSRFNSDDDTGVWWDIPFAYPYHHRKPVKQ